MVKILLVNFNKSDVKFLNLPDFKITPASLKQLIKFSKTKICLNDVGFELKV